MPMTHEARQFHHILDMVDQMEEEFLRKRVKHLPLYIAAHNFERERLNRVTAATTDNDTIEDNPTPPSSTPHTVPYMSQPTHYTNLAVNTYNTITRPRDNIKATAADLSFNKNYNKYPSSNRYRSISTSESLIFNADINCPNQTNTTTSESISVNNDLSDNDSLNDSNATFNTSQTYDEIDNFDDCSSFFGTGSLRRKYGPRKSPNSRLTHNMNEKNRRADLRGSLERLKLALPHYRQKNCKSTTADILQSGYKYIRDNINLHNNLLHERDRLFDTAKKRKLDLCHFILSGNVSLYVANDDTIRSTDSNNNPILLDDHVKLPFKQFIDIADYLQTESLKNLDFCQILFPGIDYKLIENSRRKYFQTASITLAHSNVRLDFSLTKKVHMLPTPNVLVNRREYSKLLGYKTIDSKLLEKQSGGNTILQQSYSNNNNSKVTFSNTTKSDVIFSTKNDHVTFSAVKRCSDNLSQYNHHNIDEDVLLPNSTGKNNNSGSAHSTHSNTMDNSATTTDFINTSRSSCASSNINLNVQSATTSDENEYVCGNKKDDIDPYNFSFSTTIKSSPQNIHFLYPVHNYCREDDPQHKNNNVDNNGSNSSKNSSNSTNDSRTIPNIINSNSSKSNG